MKDLLVRFCEYDYSADDRYVGAKFITSFKIEETYDRFANMIARLVGHDVELKGSVYTVDDYRLNYSGEEDEAVCLNVYCIGC